MHEFSGVFDGCGALLFGAVIIAVILILAAV